MTTWQFCLRRYPDRPCLCESSRDCVVCPLGRDQRVRDVRQWFGALSRCFRAMLAEAEPWASPELRAGWRSTATAWEAACGWPAGRGRCHSAAAHEGRNGPWKSAVLLSFRDELCSLVLLRPSDQAETGPARMAVGCGWALACLWLQFLMRLRLRAALLASNHSFRIISVCRGARLKHHPRVGRVHPSGALTDLIVGGGCRRRARSRLDFMLFFLFLFKLQQQIL